MALKLYKLTNPIKALTKSIYFRYLEYKFDLFTVENKKNAIDIGCFIAKTEHAKQVGFHDKSLAGDATYFEGILTLKPKILKIPMALFVHN